MFCLHYLFLFTLFVFVYVICFCFCLRYLFLFTYSVMYLLCVSSSCESYVASFSGLSIFVLLTLRYSLTFILYRQKHFFIFIQIHFAY
jgi:hypothetical protein